MLNDRKKGKNNAFNSYKLKSKMCVVYLEVTATNHVQLLDFVTKMPENGRNMVFRAKHSPKKVPLLFFFFLLFKFLFLFSSKSYNTKVKIKNVQKNFIQQTQNKTFKSKN